MARNVDFGEILGETIALLSRNARIVGVFTLVIGGLTAVGILTGLTETTTNAFGYGSSVDATDTSASGLFELFKGVVGIVAGYLLAKLFLASRDRLRDDRNRFWPYLGLLILWILGLFFGFILLVIPGIILLVRWSAATGFLIGDQRGIFESFKSSWEATKGHSWSIFFVAFALMIFVVGISIAIRGFLSAISPIADGVASAFLGAYFNALGIAFTVAVYVLVHDDNSELGEVFS